MPRTPATRNAIPCPLASTCGTLASYLLSPGLCWSRSRVTVPTWWDVEGIHWEEACTLLSTLSGTQGMMAKPSIIVTTTLYTW